MQVRDDIGTLPTRRMSTAAQLVRRAADSHALAREMRFDCAAHSEQLNKRAERRAKKREEEERAAAAERKRAQQACCDVRCGAVMCGRFSDR